MNDFLKLFFILVLAAGGSKALAQDSDAESLRLTQSRIIANTRFIHIPGPNPILNEGGAGVWDEKHCETAGILKDGFTYYLYYHALGQGQGYRTGVATASHPLGPWKKYEKNPILPGPCAKILKENDNEYYAWYQENSGRGSVYLATATHPLGPWIPYENNPVATGIGYVSGVVKVNGTYFMYHEIGDIFLATATKPEGPWTKYSGPAIDAPSARAAGMKIQENPILKGDIGAWDSDRYFHRTGGYSEGSALYHDGVFHIFYTAGETAKTQASRIESIGYAFSFDGYNYTKHPYNPIGTFDRLPDVSALSEVQVLWEPPFYYAYHTMRYKSKGAMTGFDMGDVKDATDYEADIGNYVENIGVSVFATQIPFRLKMPVINSLELASHSTSSLEECPPLCLEQVRDLAISVKCDYERGAAAGLRVHIKASHDGLVYDTEDLYSFDLPFRSGERVSKTVELQPKVMYLKILVENPDDSHEITGINITATLGG